MNYPIWFWAVIIAFCSAMCYLINGMLKDKNWLIRFLGYAVAIVMAVAMLGLVLEAFFEIDLYHILPMLKV